MDVYFRYKYDELLSPTLKALLSLGGSGLVKDIELEVINMLNLSIEEVKEIHEGKITKLAHRLATAREKLRQSELIEYSMRGVWSITNKGLELLKIAGGNLIL